MTKHGDGMRRIFVRALYVTESKRVLDGAALRNAGIEVTNAVPARMASRREALHIEPVAPRRQPRGLLFPELVLSFR
jgi:hypothetical protein